MLESRCHELGVAHYGWARLQRPLFMEAYLRWLDSGLHADLDYLAAGPRVPEMARAAKSAFVFAFDYVVHPEPCSEEEVLFSSLSIARYAKGQDYHIWIQQRLNILIEDLKRQHPNEMFWATTDANPLSERDLAYQAGLGWFGKNTCLINQQSGSFFLLGEILTTLESSGGPSRPLAVDLCGKCNACIAACPTGALKPFEINTNLCISYWTIEAKKNPPPELREKIGNWFFGCDICQEVCPWNHRPLLKLQKPIEGIAAENSSLNCGPTLAARKAEGELRRILTSGSKELARRFKNSAISRARGWRLKKNAILVATNMGLVGLRPEISKLSDDPRLSELVLWSMQKLESRP